jgi:tRNA (guanine-N7-)-methyltransferase
VRQKKLKFVDLPLLETMGVTHDQSPIDFPDRPIHLEIGSGKGQFITKMANAHKDIHFVAMEVNMNVCYRIAEKKATMGLDNLSIILDDASKMSLYLGDRKADKLYLLFSDPWPKKRHHKRRLTYPSYLALYKELLTDDAQLVFRTDHRSFFEDSLVYIHGMTRLIDVTYDLPESDFMTEYEEKKRKNGPIHQLIVEVNHDA